MHVPNWVFFVYLDYLFLCHFFVNLPSFVSIFEQVPILLYSDWHTPLPDTHTLTHYSFWNCVWYENLLNSENPLNFNSIPVICTLWKSFILTITERIKSTWLSTNSCEKILSRRRFELKTFGTIVHCLIHYTMLIWWNL